MNRWTLRVRLTVLYGAVLFVAGAILLGTTYFLVERSFAARSGLRGDVDLNESGIVPRELVVRYDGRELPATEAIQQIRKQQTQFEAETLEMLLTGGVVALLIVGTLGGAFGWLVADRALQPLQRITDTARRIASAPAADRGLHERIALDGPVDEVKELADMFDSMLERLDRSFDGQRRFVANASHELRTPLALNRALVELTVTRPGAEPETKRLGESLLAVNERHERLIDGLLTLAESETAVIERMPVDLAEVTNHVVSLAGPEAAERDLTLSGEVAPAPTLGDPVLLERLVQNLVENGVRHNIGSGGWLSARTGVVDGRIRLVVANTGPAVPRYEIETLFQPFRRLAGERVSSGTGRGFGLGLSIVRAIARAHGGDVMAEPRDGGGLVVTVTLPVAR